MKSLTFGVAAALALSGCALVQGADTAIENTVMVVQDNKQPKPTILLAHGCDGMMERQHYYFGAKEIAAWGYNVVMVDSFSKRRQGNICTRPTKVLPTERAKDIADTSKWVMSQPWHKGKIGLIGYSHGGSTALSVAGDQLNPHHVAAAVAYYPHCNYIFVGSNYFNNRIPLQMHSGDQDQWTPVKLCITDSWSSPKLDYEIHTYAGATHSFDIPYASRTLYGQFLAHDPKATREAAARTRAFFNKHVMN